MDAESNDPQSMLNFYRRVLALRHRLQTADTSCRWLDCDAPSGLNDGADWQPGGVIAYARENGWACVTNFASKPAALPGGEVLLTSAPLTDDGLLPQDASAWLSLR